MSKHKNLKRNLLICLLAGSAVMYTLPLHAATSVVANNALPQNGQFFNGNEFIQGTANEKGNGFDFADIGSITKPNDLTMNVHQNNQNAVIKWDSFDVGGNATVNFTAADAFKNNFNTLNYVNSGSASQIYGTINGLGGNIYVVNTAGVQIGPSAQINVGSLHVSNKNLDNINWEEINNKNPNINDIMSQGTTGNAALMSLGNINATKVTFEGDGRIVIDSERIKDKDGNAVNNNFEVHTNDAGNVIIGYEAYNNIGDDKGTYEKEDKTFNNIYLNDSTTASGVKGYMWVEDVEQLQAINTNLEGNYALRNSIDATSTSSWNNNEGFKQIGTDGNEFKGNFDGLDYNIFGLTINRAYEDNVGLFGAVDGANINNVTLVGGSITGKDNVGAIVGSANNTTLTNVVNSAAVSGNSNVGGIVGSATNSAIKDAINTGTINGSGDNVGGLIGNLQNSKFIEATDTTKEVEKGLIGNSYNLGDVSGKGHNVGGLVGSASNSTIGDGTNLVYNRLDVTGAYNVGGIVGNMEGSTVKYAENSGTVEATGYTTEDYTYHTAHYASNANYTVNGVYAANAGGIAGTSSDDSTITDVLNTADVSSSQKDGNDYYDAGNVGGIVGKAVDTNITNATNQENEIRGAHNVGGVAGYFGNSSDDSSQDYTVTNGINDGGDIMATGARNASGFVQEWVRAGNTGGEQTIVGNMGGIVGYLDGDNVYVTGSANRGTVHSLDIEDQDDISDASRASNTGGVVGKIDRSSTESLTDLQNNGKVKAAVSDSYNTGDVRGYMGVGGIVGMMYNGEVVSSYNIGTINTTRQVGTNSGTYYSVNMGGIVGDTTEGTNAQAVIYDVYNEGQIGDETFTYYARHVGGIVGRLNGTVDKAYNTGDIYNGYNVVGGIAGWFYDGTISNSFNTGNITVVNNENTTAASQVGGIAGGVSGSTGVTIENAYNLGTLRSYYGNGGNAVGGIIGKVTSGNAAVNITNVYTTGNIYAEGQNGASTAEGLGSIYGDTDGTNIRITNGYYITPEDINSFINLNQRQYNNNQQGTAILYENRYDPNQYNFTFATQSADGSNIINENAPWRIYAGTTPILNAFLPNAEDYFSGETGHTNTMNGIDSIQYGTAYNPLLTIINANVNTDNLTFDWGNLGITGAASIAVYNSGLTLYNVDTSDGTGYYSGLLYSDGDLSLNTSNKDGEAEEDVSGNISLGSGAKLYGSSVAINADGTVTVYGSVTATGNEGASDITVNAGDVNVYGTLTSVADDGSTKVAGILGGAVNKFDFGNISNENAAATSIGDRFAKTVESQGTGSITITANSTKTVENDDGTTSTVTIGEGNVGLYYGNKGEGITTTGGDLTVNATGDVYVDSDLDIGDNLTFNGTGADSEVVLDITNIGEVQEKNDNTDADNSTDYLHDFLEHFANTTNNSISFGDTQDAKITVDMWNGNTLDLTKFNNGSTSLVAQLGKLHITDAGTKTAQQLTHIWVSNGEQLKGIQKAANSNDDVLSYNFALKNDINASDVEDYVAIGTGNKDASGNEIGFTGTFDGRGNRIIGLDTTKDSNGGNSNTLTNAGIFSTVGKDGVVKDVNIYSGTFTGTTTAGAVAGVNSGRIEGIVTFGNTVTSNGNAGGIVGVNNSGSFSKNETTGSTNDGVLTNGIYDVESTGSVIAGSSTAVAGGLVGTNDGGLANSFSDSAVTVKVDNQNPVTTAGGLGGVVGVNTEKGNVQYVDSLGVTNGGATGSSNIGGIIGTNNGNMYSGYNESIVSGNDKVGGIIGENKSGKTVSNVVNATSVTGATKGNDISEYVGGLVGSNSGSVTNGRNNGTITGTNYVGGMVGSNAQGATLTNLVNDSSAEILGVTYVGGIAGSNSGTITADEDNDNLVNRGSITGHTYVGGVAGVNTSTGKIANTNNSVVLNANEDVAGTAEYFGGVVGQNSGLIDGATNTSDIDITAVGGSYVGGIIGQNTASGRLEGKILNQGSVAGKSNVGGIIGLNENEKVLQGAASNRLTVTNEGNVTAEDGGAAGIFYANTGNISYADITNTGTVTGGSEPDSVTGGLFGTNSGEITNSTLTNTGIVTSGGTVGGLIGNNSGSATDSTFTNSGTVSGNTNVGGLFGTNSGKFETSSLINTVNAQVIGTQNVGGLIGTNTGIIIGGRNEAQETDEDGNVTAEEDSYYKYKVYNNGTITVTGSGSNIGGLIGDNQGTLEAGYNTGAINAGGSENVGGIAGSNSGTIDQVFNTVMTENGENQTITGGTNVGGLVGENTNSGSLSNAYNTTNVNGNSNVGNAVGVNSGIITNIYTTNTTGQLIGSGYDNGKVTKAYSFVANDTSTTEVISETADTDNDGITDRVDSDSYGGFDFSNDTWKNYDGSGNPLLKVFLTTVKVDTDDLPNLVYNTKDQDLNIDGLTGVNGAFSAADDFTAYENNNSLIQNTGFEHKNAGTYDNWLYSQQIASGSQDGTFNPNNLGYDIELTHDIDKAQITVDLNEVERTYGDTTILNNGNYNYSYDFANVTDETDLANLRNELNNNDVLSLGNVDKTKDDGGLVEDGTKTNNAGDYNWTGTVNIADGYQGNYEFVLTTEQSNDNQSSLGTNGTSITTIGDSIVNAKTITLGDFLATIVYGNQNNEFTYSGYEDWLEDQLVYGDHIGLSFSGATTGGAYETDKGNRDTADVGTYTDSISANVALTNNEKGNYVIESGSVTGDILVTPAQLDIVLGDVSHVYGSPNLNGYAASFGNNNGLVNGDSGIISINVGSVTDDALSTDKQYTNDVDNYHWTVGEGGLSADGFKLGNYAINFVNEGSSKVTKANLTININDVNMTYGDLENWISGQYGYNASDVDGQKLVNGDSLADVIAGMTYNNTAYNSDGTTKNVAEGNFAITNDDVTQGTKYGNYNITFNNGTVTMDKKQITIGANNEQILVGETPNYSGTDIDSVLVNSDSLNGNYYYGVADGTIESVVGAHNGVIGVWISGAFYDLSQNVDWTQAGNFFSNYEVNYIPGTLTVSAYDIPEDWPHNRWDYLFNDAPFDRNKDFRERKAEVNFVDGGMEI